MSGFNKEHMIALSARMDGHAVVVKNLGRQVKVSDMELMVLVNFTEIALMSLFCELDGERGEEAAAALDEHIAAIRKRLANPPGSNNGLMRLQTSAASLLRSERFQQYLIGGDA